MNPISSYISADTYDKVDDEGNLIQDQDQKGMILTPSQILSLSREKESLSEE